MSEGYVRLTYKHDHDCRWAGIVIVRQVWIQGGGVYYDPRPVCAEMGVELSRVRDVVIAEGKEVEQ